MLGTIAVFDIQCSGHIMSELKQQFLKKGLFLGPFGDTVYVLPPYSIAKEELHFAHQKT